MKKLCCFLLCFVLLGFALGGCNKAEDRNGSVADTSDASSADYSSAESSEDISIENSSSEDSSSEDSSEERTVTVYIPVEGDVALSTKQVEFDGTDEGLIGAMVEAGALPEDTKMNFLRVADGIAHVDLNKAYADYVYAGTFAQYYGIGCVVNTLIDRYDVDRVFITADGKIVTGAEGDYFYKPLEYFGEREDKHGKEYAVLYRFDVNDATFTPEPITFDGTAEGLVKAWSDSRDSDKTYALNSFSVKDGVAYADMNATFGELVYMGLFTEMEVYSLAFSLLSYFGMTEAESVFVSIDGVPFKSDYSGLESEAIRFSPDMVLAK